MIRALSTTAGKADAAVRGDAGILQELASSLIRPEPDNLVERPWGGSSIRGYKRIPDHIESGAWPWGEAFEISAFDDDAEARQYASRLCFEDGSSIALPALIAARARELLGDAFVRRYGPCFPLLPKTLSVKELLSVQGHPEGHTEVYIIIDAEPGATLRLGFNRDIDAADMAALLERGIAEQEALLAQFGPDFAAIELQLVAQPWFADRQRADSELCEWLAERLPADVAGAALARLVGLKDLYWHVLDSMNAIEVQAGQVIYNATPARLLGESGRRPSAEVHALGNPEGREILALEVRLPGPTFRAWDNVRFPRRDVDVGAAIDALNLKATRAEEFVREPVPVPERDGVFVSVDCEFFRVEHLRSAPGRRVSVPADGPHSLHCLEGAVECRDATGRPIGSLARGESALVPVGVGAYSVESSEPAHVVRVNLSAD